MKKSPAILPEKPATKKCFPIHRVLVYGLLCLVWCTSAIAQTQIGSDIDGEYSNSYLGASVSLSSDGTTLAIGAPHSGLGHVEIYSWNGSAWIQQGANIIDTESSCRFGNSVSLSSDGSVLAIGAPGHSFSHYGKVRVYIWNGSDWVQQGADIVGIYQSYCGYAVSLSSDGSVLAIGLPGLPGSSNSQTRVYTWDGSAWMQQGADIVGESNFDRSGSSVALNGDGSILAIGAPLNASAAGHVRVYKWEGSAWVQQGPDVNGEAASDYFGTAVSLSSDGMTLAIGAIKNDGMDTDAGHVRVHTWNGTYWPQQGADIDGEGMGDLSGYSVSLNSDGTILAVGAINNDGTGTDAGHTRVFIWNGFDWLKHGTDIDGEASSDQSGGAVTLSNDGMTLAIGAALNDETGSNAGHVRVYSLLCANTSGAITLFGCDSVTVPSGDETYTVGGTYIDTVPNAAGCDSLISVEVNINDSASVTQAGDILTANSTGATYQWIYCDSTAIIGATNQSFSTTFNGNFAVIVTANGCTDTSTCFAVTVVGIMQNSFGSNLQLYPNQSSGRFTIAGITTERWQVFNSLGKLVKEGRGNEINLIGQASGMYLLRVGAYTEMLLVQ